jgi:peptidoglycan/xylan/chitin deacetylase (PgdA/CDA1 family)
MKATFYVVSNLTGRDSYYMTWDQIRDLAADGHEIGGHTLDHVNLPALLDPAERHRQVCDDRRNLLARGYTVTDFAYPYAAVDPGVEAIARDCGYTSARGVGSVACDSCPPAESIPPADPFLLRTPDGITTATRLKEIKHWVTDAEAKGGGWIQFVFHHICDQCAENSISRADFVALLDWLQRRAGAGTVVKTVAQALDGSVSVAPLLDMPGPRTVGSR